MRERNKDYPGCWLEAGTFYCRYKHPNTGKDTITKVKKISRKPTKSMWQDCYKYRLDLTDGSIISAQEIRAERKLQDRLKLSVVFKNYSNAKVSEKFRKTGVKYHKDQSIHGTDVSRMKNHILPFFGDVDINSLTTTEVDEFKDYLEAKDLAPQTIKHALAHMRRLFEFMDMRVKIAMPIVKNTVTEDLTLLQQKRLVKLLTADGGNVADMMLFIMNTGCRPIEVRTLRWKNINFQRKIIELKERKGGVDTVLPMNRGAEIILRRRKEKGAGKLVFSGLDNKTYLRPAKKFAISAGLPPTHRPSYCLRHWYATELIAQGVDILTVSRLLGHTDVKTTMRYAEARQEALVSAVDKIAVVMGA